jgi:hypothetical protein
LYGQRRRGWHERLCLDDDPALAELYGYPAEEMDAAKAKINGKVIWPPNAVN